MRSTDWISLVYQQGTDDFTLVAAGDEEVGENVNEGRKRGEGTGNDGESCLLMKPLCVGRHCHGGYQSLPRMPCHRPVTRSVLYWVEEGPQR